MILDQENARALGGLICIVGLLTVLILEILTGVDAQTGLWILVGLILALFGLDDAYWIFRGPSGQHVPAVGHGSDHPSSGYPDRDQHRDERRERNTMTDHNNDDYGDDRP